MTANKEKVYFMVKDGATQIMAAAALILTINLGIITFGIDPLTDEEILNQISIPIKISGIFLIISLISGGVALGFLYDVIESGNKDTGAVWSYRVEFWTFVIGLIAIFVAVWIRLG